MARPQGQPPWEASVVSRHLTLSQELMTLAVIEGMLKFFEQILANVPCNAGLMSCLGLLTWSAVKGVA